jgi:CBS domain-containing protein
MARLTEKGTTTTLPSIKRPSYCCIHSVRNFVVESRGRGKSAYAFIYFERNPFYSMSVVSEIMSQKGVVTVDSKDNPSALDVAKLMAKNRIGSVLVIEGDDNKKPVGIVTERDIIKKVSAQNKSADQVAVRHIMSSPLVTIKSIDSIDTAAETIAENKVKRLVVLEQDGSMVGVLSVSDIAKKLAKILTEDYSRYRSLRNLLDMG